MAGGGGLSTVGHSGAQGVPEPSDKRSANCLHHLGSKVNEFVLNAFECHAPDIGAILKFFPIHSFRG